MSPSKPALLLLVVITASILGGCAFLEELFDVRSDRSDGEARAAGGADAYGADSDVRATVQVVKSVGKVNVISSRAVRLPALPLSAITTFDYQLPVACGGHHFRVYETNGTQILEFEYAPATGEESVIRDYLSGPNSFVQPGLWTAYDHTADGVSEMSIRYESRGSGALVGTYSRGPITDLTPAAKHALGIAYERALREARGCRRAA